MRLNQAEVLKWEKARMRSRRELTSACNSRFDQGVQFLVAADRQLQVAGRDSLHFQIFGRVSRQLQHLVTECLSRCSGTGITLTSAVRYSRIAAEYTAAVAPTRP